MKNIYQNFYRIMIFNASALISVVGWLSNYNRLAHADESAKG